MLFPCQAANPVLEKNVAALAQELPGLYGQLRQHAPKARILVVGYPEIFPDPATVNVDGCSALNFRGLGINSADVTFLRRDARGALWVGTTLGVDIIGAGPERAILLTLDGTTRLRKNNRERE